MAEEVGALRISLGLDAVDFTQGMKNINARINALNSEFKAITAGSGRFDNSLEALRSRADVLSRTFETQKSKVDELKRKYDQSKAAKGEDATETIRLANAYNRAVASMKSTENRLQTVNRQIDEQTDSFRQLEIQVNQSLENVDRELRVLQSTFDATTAGIEDFGRETAQLEQRADHLTSTLRLQERQVEELTRLHREAANSKGEDARETQELQIRLNRAIQEMRQTERQLESTTTQINQQSNAWRRLRTQMRDTGEHLDRVGGRMQSVGSEITQSFGAATLAIGASLGVSAKKALDFESQISSVKSVMSPDEVNEFGDAIEGLSLEMGAKTKYSAMEAAQGIEELIKAGVGVTDIVNGGLEGALSLAVAGELELADAAEIASTALNAFKNENMSVMHAADLLAGAANASATSVGEMKYGLSMVSAVASGVGLSFEDTTTALAAFAQNGLKGSDAGTSLKTMLLRLSPSTNEAAEAFSQLGLSTYNTSAGYKYLVDKGMKPTARSVDELKKGIMELSKQELGASASKADLKKRYEANLKASGLMSSAFYDESGSLKSMAQIADILQKSMKGLNDEQRQNYLNTMFGTDAIRAGNILYKEGAKGITDMAAAMNKIKSADVAATKLNNVKGRIEMLRGAAETAAISFGQALLPTIDKVVATVQKATDWFNELSPAMKENIATGLVVTATVTGIVTALGIGLTVIGGAVTGFGALTTAAAGLGTALTVATGPIGLVVGGIAALTVAGIAYVKHKKNEDDAVKESTNVNLDHAKSLLEQSQNLEDLTSQYEDLREKNKLSNSELLKFRDLQDELKFATSKEEIQGVQNKLEGLTTKSGLSRKELNKLLELNDELAKKVPTASQAFSEQGNSILTNTDSLKLANKELRDNLQMELELQRLKAEAKLDEDIQKRTDALKGLNKVLNELTESRIEKTQIETELNDLIKRQQEDKLAGDEIAAQHKQLDIDRLQAELTIQKDHVATIAEEVEEKKESLDKTEKQIEKTQALYTDMINIQLAAAGINLEGDKGIEQLDQAITKTQQRLSDLDLIKQKHGELNETQQEEYNNLSGNLNMYKNTKGEIQGIQSEQGAVNSKIDEGTKKAGEMSDILSDDEIKDIAFTGDGVPEAKAISEEAGRNVQKDVDVSDHGKANSIHEKAEKDAHKNIWVSIKKTASDLWDKVTSGFATGTRNAPEGLAWVGENGPELVHLPQGAKVIPHLQSEAVVANWDTNNKVSSNILKNWNIPMYADGTVNAPSGWALVGEKGRELAFTGESISTPSTGVDSSLINKLDQVVQKLENLSFPTIQPAPVIMDGYEVANIQFNYINEMIQDAVELILNRKG